MNRTRGTPLNAVVMATYLAAAAGTAVAQEQTAADVDGGRRSFVWAPIPVVVRIYSLTACLPCVLV